MISVESEKTIMKYPHLKKGDSKFLGAGGFGTVYLSKHNNKIVATKRIEKRFEVNVNKLTEESSMSLLNHPNVLKLIAVDEDEDFKYIVLELCDSTLHDYIIGKDDYCGALPPEPITALYQMASGLQHIHSMDLVHRDITPQNVLIQRCDNQSTILKISDFGFCKLTSERGSFSISKDGRGKTYYIAPEMLTCNGKDGQQRRATIACDIFSLGCLFFCFLTKGRHPFSIGNDDLSININIRRGIHNLDEPINSQLIARETIRQMIHCDPISRLKIDAVVIEIENQQKD